MPCFKSNDDKTVEQARKEIVSALGENISIRRFVRYTLGEGLQKKSEDFAAEVAAQTAKKEEAPAAVCSFGIARQVAFVLGWNNYHNLQISVLLVSKGGGTMSKAPQKL
jgi:hypothetical protein